MFGLSLRTVPLGIIYEERLATFRETAGCQWSDKCVESQSSRSQMAIRHELFKLKLKRKPNWDIGK